MTKQNARWQFILGALVASATVLVQASAHAQSGQGHPPLPPASEAPSNHAPAQGHGAPLAQSLTPTQLEAFVQLIGEPMPVVWQHLVADPGLVPLAAAAADTRTERKSSGKTMTIAGFTILGVGAITGYVIVLLALRDDLNQCAYGSDSCGNGNSSDGQIKLGVALALVSTGVGLALGIPGIIRMAKQTEVETAAVDRYQFPGWGRPPVNPPWQSSAGPAAVRSKPLSLSLLSFTF